jgi:hypothetical protein
VTAGGKGARSRIGYNKNGIVAGATPPVADEGNMNRIPSEQHCQDSKQQEHSPEDQTPGKARSAQIFFTRGVIHQWTKSTDDGSKNPGRDFVSKGT